eukprot:c13936_g1_i2.p5 GENE.c13936_g1_i2~~c13936_g1_i2.p5  ORF type:complete len:116 (+),score=32.04 c13936_g1_i2:796-1143(+)
MYEYCAARQRAMTANRPEAPIAFLRTIVQCKLLFNAIPHANVLASNAQTMPVLVLVGEFDKTVPTKPTVKGIKEVLIRKGGMSSVRIATIPKTRHCFFLENRDDTNKHIFEFLKD